jgi:hypothetical protein
VKDAADRCEKRYWDPVGFLSPLEIGSQWMRGAVVIIRTDVGILRGEDQSAYVYERRESGWQRLWQTEQPIVAGPGMHYRPQYIDTVRISWPDDKAGERHILSLGHQVWCTSNFYPVYLRLWRAGAAGSEAKLLLDEEQPAYLGRHIPPIEGSVGENDALIEFSVPSIDREVHFYESIRHYKIDGDKVARIDPVALSPRDFIDEWLRGSWAESSAWTAASRRAELRP